MLSLVPRRAFSEDYTILRDFVPLGALDLHKIKEASLLYLDGPGDAPHRMGRRGLFGAYYLEAPDGTLLAAADRPSLFRERFVVAYDGVAYDLVARGLLARSFELRDDGAPIGAVEREGVLSRRVRADLPAHWPLPVQAFVAWLVIVLWRRRRSG